MSLTEEGDFPQFGTRAGKESSRNPKHKVTRWSRWAPRVLLSTWERLELRMWGTQGSLHNRLDQLREYPRGCFASHKIFHLGLSDFPLEFGEPQFVLSLSQSHGTERMCPCSSPSSKLPWSHMVAETTARAAEAGHRQGVKGVSGLMVRACLGKAETGFLLGSLSPANCPGSLWAASVPRETVPTTQHHSRCVSENRHQGKGHLPPVIWVLRLFDSVTWGGLRGWPLWRHPELLGLRCTQHRDWVTNSCLQLKPHPQRPLRPLLGMILAFPSSTFLLSSLQKFPAPRRTFLYHSSVALLTLARRWCCFSVHL